MSSLHKGQNPTMFLKNLLLKTLALLTIRNCLKIPWIWRKIGIDSPICLVCTTAKILQYLPLLKACFPPIIYYCCAAIYWKPSSLRDQLWTYNETLLLNMKRNVCIYIYIYIYICKTEVSASSMIFHVIFLFFKKIIFNDLLY